ncbi:RHS repeat protein [Sphingomonas sp. CL5.1]|uniref:RHS repeat protein n=1 Tax=Sphingomonas sp. CL5.1 TaxID=2653203 RepID=UPI001582001C|nr:RHS repeat protein [Sphingomonas sp. CL5.1]QKR99746.1 RHS repeat protein [Sphingomonas sp. CL5.1]
MTSLTNAAGTTSYSYADSGSTRTTTVTDPLGHVATYVFNMNISQMTSRTDATGKVLTRQYDSAGRLTKNIAPEGNYTQYTYDGRGNVTELRQVAKAGSGLADAVSTAGYDATCSSAAKCNKPNWTKDASGNQTDYTYDLVTGNILKAEAPAATPGGARPTATYSYTTVNGAQLLSSTSTCSNAATCVGSVSESKTSLGYNANGLPTTVTRQAGDGSVVATTTLGYDNVGNVTSVDGPLSGTGDTAYYRYNADREVVGVIAPDPDGAGSLKRKALRNTYDAKGRVVLAELGTVTDASDPAWTAFTPSRQVATTYDGVDRPLSQTVSAGGTVYAVSQNSYDHQRLDCTATRMNSAAWGSLPASACTLQATGSAGPDRVTKISYDNADRQTKVTTAYGTAEASDDVTVSYTSNGNQATVADANGNVTSYAYDGFDRLSRTCFQVTTSAACASTPGDYEQLGYDANGNVTSRRLRDGKSIGFGYDALNRRTSMTFGNPVDVSDSNVAYGYDLLGRLTLAQDVNGHKTGYSYDALGRGTSESGAWATLSSQYDVAGRRTRLTWDDGFFVTYEYDTTGNMTAIRENGGFLLASYGYDDLGRRVSRTLGNGTSTSYGYDGVSRLTALNLNGASQPNAMTFGFNPAGQISSRTTSNDGFAWTGAANVDRPYTVNGLNQYTASGSVTPTYDGRGNVTSAGGSAYLYNSKNQLSGANGTYIYYDPAGRIDQVTQSGLAWDWDGSRLVTEHQGGVIANGTCTVPAWMSRSSSIVALVPAAAPGSTPMNVARSSGSPMTLVTRSR